MGCKWRDGVLCRQSRSFQHAAVHTSTCLPPIDDVVSFLALLRTHPCQGPSALLYMHALFSLSNALPLPADMIHCVVLFLLFLPLFDVRRVRMQFDATSPLHPLHACMFFALLISLLHRACLFFLPACPSVPGWTHLSAYCLSLSPALSLSASLSSLILHHEVTVGVF